MTRSEELQQFDLRYDDRVLAFHAYVNTDRDPGTMAKQIIRAVQGSKMDAQACWTEGWDDGSAVWLETCRRMNTTNDSELRYGGKVLAFHVYVNTDRDAYHIQKAVLRIARGPRLDACMVWAEAYEGENGRKTWGVIQDVVVKVHASPNAVPFDPGDANP